MRRSRFAAGILAAGILLATAGTAAAEGATVSALDTGTTVSGAGSTFVANAIDQWRADFKKSTGVSIAYTGVGSGAGRTQLIAGTVDFAGSDTAASAADASSLKSKYGSYVYVPAIAGGIALAYNVPSLKTLKLTGPTIAKIFNGVITNWNDPAIAADNGSAGPNLPIQAFVRSDSSGTSNVFTQYLTAVAPSDWKSGVSSQFPTDNGQIAKSGSDGVSNAVAAANGGIGYAEVSYATERKLSVVQVKNATGNFEMPDTGSVTAALDDATINADGTLALAFNGNGPSAYPISTTTYFIIPTKMDAKKGENLKGFLTYVLSGAGQASVVSLGYAPLPAKVLSNGLTLTSSINPSAAAPAPAPIQRGTVGSAATPTKVVRTPAAVTVGAGASAPAAALARTGANEMWLALVGFAALALGLVLVRQGRRA